MASSSQSILVILIRGLAFRGGGRASQDPSAPLRVSSSPDEQIQALRSLQQNVIAPARTLGWRVGLAIDVVMPSHLHSAWQQAKSASGLRAATIERISETYRERTQSESMVDMMIWANRTGPAEWGSRSAMLISRADLVFRKPLPLPAPPDEDGKLMLSHKSLHQKTNLTRCVTMWSELIIYVPRRLEPKFTEIVTATANRQGENLHSMIDVPVPGAHPSRERCATGWVPGCRIGDRLRLALIGLPELALNGSGWHCSAWHCSEWHALIGTGMALIGSDWL